MTTIAVDSLDAARVHAIEDSGWGRSFKFFQPRNLAFWVYAWLVVNGMVSFALATGGQLDAFGPALGTGAVVFALYGALFWWFTVHIDRYSRQSMKLAVVAFLWGGFAATWMMAALANGPIRALYAKAFGQAFMLDWSAALTAPFTEELAKGAGFLLLITLAPKLIRTAFDGFVLGAFIGLGFQILEDIQYATVGAATQFGSHQLQAMTQTVVMRILVGVTAHILFSVVFCAGVVYFLGTTAEPRRRGRGLALMLIAMLLHGSWDGLGAIVSATGSGGAALYLGIIVAMAIAIAVVIAVFHMTVPREREYMREVMAPEVARGVITDADLDALAGDRKARKAYRHSAHGHRDHVHARHILTAAHDLADELAAANGTTTERVEFARAEILRVRK